MNFINMFAPTGGEQSTNDFSLTQAVYIEDQTIAFRVEDEGTVEKPILNYTLFAYKNISESVKTELIDRVNYPSHLEWASSFIESTFVGFSEKL